MHYVVVLVDNKCLMNSKSMKEARHQSASTCYTGAIRFRVYPRLSATPAEGKATLTLEVMPEPKILGWYGQTELNVTVKIDDKSQAATESIPLEDPLEPTLHEYTPILDFRRGQGLRPIDLPLDLRGKELRSVKSMKGTLSARVESTDYPVLT